MGETDKLSHRNNEFYHALLSSNLPHGGGFLILDATIAVSGTFTSRTDPANMIGDTFWLFKFSWLFICSWLLPSLFS